MVTPNLYNKYSRTIIYVLTSGSHLSKCLIIMLIPLNAYITTCIMVTIPGNESINIVLVQGLQAEQVCYGLFYAMFMGEVQTPDIYLVPLLNILPSIVF